MKALNRNKHKTILTNILIDIYKDNKLAPILGFKGGTASMLFYDLPRFSVDLDFDLIPSYKEESEEIKNIVTRMTSLISKKYTIKDQSIKYNTLFWLISYEYGLANIKIEISTREHNYNHYHKQPFYGVQLNILDIKDMIAHKLVAATERTQLANRDLFDIHFFLGTQYASEINYDIIQDRTGMNAVKFYNNFLAFLDRIKPTSILEGLGEVLDDYQKDWAKNKLIIELKGLIQRQIDFIENEDKEIVPTV